MSLFAAIWRVRVATIHCILHIPIIVVLLLASALLVLSDADAASEPQVTVLTVDGVVNPVVANYLDGGIRRAEREGSVACIIELDTPGGLLSSTQDITDRIMDAEVPVVVYVDRWAGSAGTFITLASHVAAMATGSRIGAAHPVSGDGEDISDAMDMKITEDAVADVRSFAQTHGRNVNAAEATVRKALSFSDQEALGIAELSEHNQNELGVVYLDPPLVELGAENLVQLIQALDGREVTLVGGETRILETDGVVVDRVEMGAMQDFLYAITDPNIAYILMSLAMLGLLVELVHPGLIFPGVAGGVCLLLAIYSLGIMEANWAGVLLMVLALGLFIAEVFTTSFGLLTVGGVVSMVVGSLILFSGGPFEIDPLVIGVVVFLFAAIFALVVLAVVRTQRSPVGTGREGLIGETAVVESTLDPKGMVILQGERWRAVAEDDRIEVGEEVIITEVKGLKLKVTRKTE